MNTTAMTLPLSARIPVGKILVWLLCLSPLIWLGSLVVLQSPVPTGPSGANPIEYLNRFLGDWAIRILIIALAVSPFRQISGYKSAARYRRVLGLFAFFYVTLHLSSYVVLDQFFDWAEIWRDILKRNYLTVGMIGFAVLIPLTLTSTKGMIKRLGGKQWQNLHKLVYVAGIAAGIHFIMMRKGFQLEPLIYTTIIASLLGYRLYHYLKKKR